MDQLSIKVKDLPNELLHHIISYFDIKPPSLQNLKQEPSMLLTCSKEQILKNLSLTCHHIRSLALQVLFHYTRVYLSTFSQAKPNSSSCDQSPWTSPAIADFTSFIASNALHVHVSGIFLYTDCDLESWHLNIPKNGLATIWRSLLRSFKPEFVTICAPPVTLGTLLSCPVQIADAWAFDMPLHLIHLSRPQGILSPTCEFNPRVPNVNLFHLAPWRHCTLNQGSSIKAYSTYHWFDKRAPSITTFHNEGRSNYDNINTIPSVTSFTYVAIFPLSCGLRIGDGGPLAVAFAAFPNLERLEVQLAPALESTILDDKARMQQALPGDLWAELETCYDCIEALINIHDDVSRLNTFVSHDATNQPLRQGIHDRFDSFSPTWYKSSEGCWRKKESHVEV